MSGRLDSVIVAFGPYLRSLISVFVAQLLFPLPAPPFPDLPSAITSCWWLLFGRVLVSSRSRSSRSRFVPIF